jgi:hypothetical protein
MERIITMHELIFSYTPARIEIEKAPTNTVIASKTATSDWKFGSRANGQRRTKPHRNTPRAPTPHRYIMHNMSSLCAASRPSTKDNDRLGC